MGNNNDTKTARKAKKTIKKIAAVCLGVATYKGIQAKRMMKRQIELQRMEELEQVNRSVAGRDTPSISDRIRQAKLRLEKEKIEKFVKKSQRGKELGQHAGALFGGVGGAVSHAGLQKGVVEGGLHGNIGGRYMADVPTAISGMSEPDFEAGG